MWGWGSISTKAKVPATTGPAVVKNRSSQPQAARSSRPERTTPRSQARGAVTGSNSTSSTEPRAKSSRGEKMAAATNEPASGLAFKTVARPRASKGTDKLASRKPT